MYFVPYTLLVAALDPGFVAAQGLTASSEGLAWLAFLWRNLLPATLGNLAGERWRSAPSTGSST